MDFVLSIKEEYELYQSYTNRPKRKVFNYKNIKKHTIQVFFSLCFLKEY